MGQTPVQAHICAHIKLCFFLIQPTPRVRDSATPLIALYRESWGQTIERFLLKQGDDAFDATPNGTRRYV